MLVWRICKQKFAPTAFSGIGAKLNGGRWNQPGSPMVYTSGTLSLAAMETFVHVDSDIIPDDLIAIAASVPDKLRVSRILPEDLPSNWRDYPAPDILKQVGTDWLKSKSGPILIVPSVIIPQEENYLINPEHKDFKRIKVQEPEPFYFDSRMWK